MFKPIFPYIAFGILTCTCDNGVILHYNLLLFSTIIVYFTIENLNKDLFFTNLPNLASGN